MTIIEKKHRVEQIEKEMRMLFFADRIDAVIVDRYNELERQWKRLTEYQMRKANPLQGAHNKKSSSLQILPFER